MRRTIALGLSISWALGAAAPFGLSMLLVVSGEIFRGHLFGLVACLLLALPIIALRLMAAPTRARWVTFAVGSAGVLVGWVSLYRLAPSGSPLPESRLRSDFLGTPRYSRLALSSLLPEIDQVSLGTRIVYFVDPIIDYEQANRIRQVSMRAYVPMEADPEFAALGSVMGFAYWDEDPHHVYAYAPPHAAGERLATIVFLHGSAGAFKAYFYLWKRFADDNHVAVVCPSFGFGNWYEPGGTDAIDRARRYAIDRLDADERRIVLAGLSNGGTGVTRAIDEHRSRYAGFVFISAVIEPAVTRRASFVTGIAQEPVLVIHGDQDDRIPIDLVLDQADVMKRDGAKVETLSVPGQDHFLFFDRPEIVFDRVAGWLKTI